jgi:hypothetical protein
MVSAIFALHAHVYNLFSRKYFSPLHSVQTGCGVHAASYQMDIDVLTPAIKRPCREADNSLYLVQMP